MRHVAAMGAVRGARDAGATQPEKGAHLVWGYFFDFLFIVTLAIWIVGLSVAGRLSQGGAAFALFALVLLVGAARAAKIGIVRLVFRIAVPVASVAAFVVWYGEGDPRAMGALLGAIGTLVVVLFGLYLMIRGVFSARHRGS